MHIFRTTVILSLLFCFSLLAQEKVTVVPEPDFAAGTIHQLVFGKHWRDLWTAPLEVELLDLETFAGGLTPLKRGGGQQTKSLRFKGNDGRIWKFRSLTKDPAKILPEELRETLVADILKDQISSANPLAPLVVAPILNQVGVLQAEPKLCKMPDSELLGEFRAEFGGLIGMIEIHPDEEFIDSDPVFENSDKFKGTLKLLSDLETKRSNKFKATAFLKARLIDCFLGDWDRHVDQWRWARFEEGDIKYWYPIPRDRDQAFAKFTGIGPSIAEYYIPQLNHFGFTFPSAKKLTWSGRFLDRRILPELTKSEWDSVTTYLKNTLTDSLIDFAVKKLPEPHYSLAGEEIFSKLKSRRDLLSGFSEEYYKLINDVVDVFGSDEEDYVEITRVDNNTTLINVYRYDDKKNIPTGAPRWQRNFDNNVTSEIRVYLGDEKDYCLIKGEVDSGPLIRVIGGNGADKLVDSSRVNGYLFSVLPIKNAENKTRFYDSGKKTSFITGSGTTIDKSQWHEAENIEERYQPQLRDRGSDFFFEPLVNGNDDDGLITGAEFELYKYNFRQDPFEYKMVFEAKYATRPSSYSIGYSALFNNITRLGVVDISAVRTKLKLTKFYGFGNETPFDSELEENDYYKLKYEYHSINIGFNFNHWGVLSARIGAAYNFSEMDLNNIFLLGDFPHGLYGLGSINSINFSGRISLDTRDHKAQPSRGIYSNISLVVCPKLLDIMDTYYKGEFDFRLYLPLSSERYNVLALRTGGSGVTDNYPFYASAMIGGDNSLRGYNRERFAGDAALFFQSELRTYLTDIKIIINGEIGFSLLAETGRVFTQNYSNKWHQSYGGGLWTSFLEKKLIVSISAAFSNEATMVYFDSKMSF